MFFSEISDKIYKGQGFQKAAALFIMWVIFYCNL